MGAALHVEVHGRGRRVALVHGFTQNGRCWGPVADDLAADHEVVAVDLPGHGGSSAVAADLGGGAELVGRAAGPATYLGYSLGARTCLHLALARPDLVEALVVVSGTAGIDDPAERARRRAADEALAARLEEVGASRFLDGWLAQPLFADLPPRARHRGERLAGATVEGLAASLRRAGTGTQEPLWDRLAGLATPTLVVAGGRDAKFSALAGRLASAIGPAAELAVVPGAGHAVHLERPDAFLAILRPFLARTTPS